MAAGETKHVNLGAGPMRQSDQTLLALQASRMSSRSIASVMGWNERRVINRLARLNAQAIAEQEAMVVIVADATQTAPAPPPRFAYASDREREDFRCAVVTACWRESAEAFRVRVRLPSGLQVQLATRQSFEDGVEVVMRFVRDRWIVVEATHV